MVAAFGDLGRDQASAGVTPSISIAAGPDERALRARRVGTVERVAEKNRERVAAAAYVTP